PNALLREVEDDLLCPVDELRRLAEPFTAEPGDLLAYPDQAPQRRRLLDDACVVLGVRRCRDERGQLGDAGCASDLLELATLLELVGQRDRVDGLTLGPEREAGPVDRAVGAAVE